jgi:hypothetical protein
MRLEDPVDGVEVELRRHVHDGEQLGIPPPVRLGRGLIAAESIRDPQL